MNFEPKKSYTLDDLKAIAGDNYTIFLSSSPLPTIPYPAKPPVYSFNDFDDNTKTIYSSLYNLISGLNPNSSFLLFAVGARVTGNWLTQQEADSINAQYNVSEYVSPYEYWSTALVLPSTMELASVGAGAKILANPSNETHRVVIPPPNE